MSALMCRVGLHKWVRFALPLNEWQEDMLRLGYPVPTQWARHCKRCFK